MFWFEKKWVHYESSKVILRKILANMNQYSSDSKKIIEILYILLGTGIITKISKHSFIYSGIKGIEESFKEYQKNENLDYLNVF